MQNAPRSEGHNQTAASSPSTSPARTRLVNILRKRARVALERHPLPFGVRWGTDWVIDFVGNLAGTTFDDFESGKLFPDEELDES